MAVLLKKVIYVIKWEWKERRLREKKGTQMLANLLSKKENMINDQITSIWKKSDAGRWRQWTMVLSVRPRRLRLWVSEEAECRDPLRMRHISNLNADCIDVCK